MSLGIDINKGIEDVGKIVDDSFESGEERQKTLTERQKIDMTSRYILPQIIRPIIALSLLVMQIAVIVAIFFGVEVPTDIIIQVGALNMTAIGFYFNSRKAEKINAKRVEGAIKIQSEKAKVEVIRERQEIRDLKKDNRRERRNKRNG